MFRAILQQQEQRHAATGPTPLADLKFENNLTNDGSVGGTCSWSGTPTYVAHDAGYAADFDGAGTNTITWTGARAALSGMSQLTVSCDVKIDSISGDQGPVGMYTAYYIKISALGGVYFYFWNGGAQDIVAAGADVADGLWHNIKCTYNATSGLATIVVDDVELTSTGGYSGSIATSTSYDLVIGRTPFNEHLNGQVDNLLIYDSIV